MKIDDATGTGYQAKVDALHRLHVDSVTFGRSELEVELGNGYNANTGLINLTDATATSVMYLLNNEDAPIVITSLFYMLGYSAGGSATDEILISVYKNPTAGTIITDAINAEMPAVNRNFGSSKVFEGSVYKGDTADNNFTDGDKIVESLLPNSAQRTVLNVGDIVVPKGSSIGVSITPPSGNTDLNVEIALSFFVDTLAEFNT